MSRRRKPPLPPDAPPPEAGAESLRELLPDVVPLRDRGARRHPDPPARPAVRCPPSPPMRLAPVRRGDRIVGGTAPGFDRRSLARLAAGEPAPDREIDLHGLAPPAARRAVREALQAALDGGERCVRIVHGRGLHSTGEPVLRDRLGDWIADPPHGPHVLAWVFDPSRREGATLVRLRTRRR